MSDIIKRAISADDRPSPAGTPPLQALRERRNTIKAAMTTVVDTATTENRSLLASESRDFDVARVRIAEYDARINELEEVESRLAAQAAAYRATGIHSSTDGGLMGGYHVGGGETYTADPAGPSFFRDLRNAQRGDQSAIERLARNNSETQVESRALGNTNGTGGSGGEFAPPAWLVSEFIRLARPGRVTADLFHHEQLPAGVSSVNLPRVVTGTAVAVQSTQNTTLPAVDLTTAALSSNIVTIGGKQVVSQQLLDQSGIPFDRLVLEDLASDYGRQIGLQALTGTGTAGQLRGYLTATSTNVVTWTQATPTAAGFYGQLARLQGQINSTRFAAPDVVVMHPRRWAWLASFTDSTGRPLVVPSAGGYNSLATPGSNVPAGLVGSILGMDVYTDPSIPVTLGAGNNQDVALAFVRDDVWLWESDLRAEAFTQPYAESMGVLFRLFGYSALIPDRYAASLGQIVGTGLVTPTFAS